MFETNWQIDWINSFPADGIELRSQEKSQLRWKPESILNNQLINQKYIEDGTCIENDGNIDYEHSVRSQSVVGV